MKKKKLFIEKLTIFQYIRGTITLYLKLLSLETLVHFNFV